MVEFNGIYRHEKDENFQNVLEKMGVGFVQRKIMSNAKPKIEVKVEGDTWTVNTIAPVKTATITFKLNQDMQMDSEIGGKKKVKFTQEGNTIVQVPTDPDENSVKVLREFSDEGLKLTLVHTPSGTTGSRYFKRT